MSEFGVRTTARDVLERFWWPQQGLEHPIVQPFGDGLINDTWLVKYEGKKYILQKLNTAVFSDPLGIASNYDSLEEHLSRSGCDEQCHPIIPCLVKAHDGNALPFFDDRCPYRLFKFVDHSVSVSSTESAEVAFEASRLLGRFTRTFADIDMKKLVYTIPHFHDLSLRFAQFQQALSEGRPDRLQNESDMLREIEALGWIVSEYERLLTENILQLRPTHHDSKLNNVLFHRDTMKGLCVVDLDTVMPGYFLSDLGDLMRTLLPPVDENSEDLDAIVIRLDLFEGIMRGYYSEMYPLLSPAERAVGVFAGVMMMYMQTLRFATDYCMGDIYYKVSTDTHNLTRTRNQLTLLQRYLSCRDQLELILQHILADLAQA